VNLSRRSLRHRLDQDTQDAAIYVDRNSRYRLFHRKIHCTIGIVEVDSVGVTEQLACDDLSLGPLALAGTIGWGPSTAPSVPSSSPVIQGPRVSRGDRCPSLSKDTQSLYK
jgi:hypothetical protein